MPIYISAELIKGQVDKLPKGEVCGRAGAPAIKTSDGPSLRLRYSVAAVLVFESAVERGFQHWRQQWVCTKSPCHASTTAWAGSKHSFQLTASAFLVN